ncbi:MAG: hypothetical protein K2X66_17760 [Cyanobacteria bacterium]|nr:hypothetical protein [Cyanobacteriota bacterium]
MGIFNSIAEIQKKLPSSTMNGLKILLAVAFLVLIGVIYVQGIETEQVGYFNDDGIYTTAGKALAWGEGYLNLHMVSTPPQIRYPILFPLFLSGIWTLNPNFPDNLYWMGLLTTGFALLGFGVVFLYLNQVRKLPFWVCVCIVLVSALNQDGPTYYSAVMSEAPYLFFSFLTLYWVERHCEKPTLKNMAITILLSALTFHTRVLGLCLMAAIGLWLLVRKQWKWALGYGGITACLTVIPWYIWVSVNKPVINEWNWNLYRLYDDYLVAFNAKNYFSDYFATFLQTMAILVNSLSDCMFAVLKIYQKIFIPADWLGQYSKQNLLLLCLDILQVILIYGLFFYFILLLVSGFRKTIKAFQTGDVSPLSISFLYLFIYVVVVVVWSYYTQIPRFLLVVMPLIWVYFFQPFTQGLNVVGASKKKAVSSVAIVVFTLFSLLSIGPIYASFIENRQQHKSIGKQIYGLWAEYKDMYSYIKTHVPLNDGVGALYSTTMYLYSNHHSMMITPYGAFINLDKSQANPGQALHYLKSLNYLGIRYVLQEPNLIGNDSMSRKNEVVSFLLKFYPQYLQPVYESKYGRIKLYKVLPVPLGAKS